MNETEVLDVGREAIWVMIKAAGPLMMVALVVGLAISLFQALTQIQEATLTFVPKIIIVFVSLLLLAPFMLHALTDFTEQIMSRAAG